MKRFLIGSLCGLFLGWLTVPFVKASYSVSTSDHVARPSSPSSDDEDLKKPQAYKWYLAQMLTYMRSVDNTLKTINANLEEIKADIKEQKEKTHV